MKFWKGSGVISHNDTANIPLMHREDDEASKAVATTSSNSSASLPLRIEATPNQVAATTSETAWPSQVKEAFTTAVKTFEEEAKELHEEAQEAFARVVRSFDVIPDKEREKKGGGEEDTEKDEYRNNRVPEEDISYAMGHNSVIEIESPAIHHRIPSNANDSTDGINRAIEAANGAVQMSNDPIKPHSNSSTSFSSKRSRTTEELSPCVQLVTELSGEEDNDDAATTEDDNRAVNDGKVRSLGNFGSLSFSLRRKSRSSKAKRNQKKESEKDSSLARESSLSSVVSSITSEVPQAEEAPNMLTLMQSAEMNQKLRMEAIKRDLARDDPTYESSDWTFDGTLETFDGELDGNGSKSEQNIGFQLLEVIDSFFHCSALFQKKSEDNYNGADDDDSRYDADASFCGTEESSTVGSFVADEDGTFDGNDDETYDDTYAGTNDGTYETYTLEAPQSSSPPRGSFLLARAKSDPISISDNGDDCSSGMDQSHIYMMMTDIRRQRNSIPKKITRARSADYKRESSNFRESTSAFSDFKSQGRVEKEQPPPISEVKAPKKVHGPSSEKESTQSPGSTESSFLGLIAAANGWAAKFLQDEPTTNNMNPIPLQAQWLQAIEESIRKIRAESNLVSPASAGVVKRRYAAEAALQQMLQEATAKKNERNASVPAPK